jgi:RNA-binding protein
MSESTLDSQQKRKLKSQAQTLEPIIKLGKGGLNERVIDEARRVLSRQGLIKVRFVDFKAEKKEMADQLAQRTDSQVIQIIGNNVVLYKPKSGLERSPRADSR